MKFISLYFLLCLTIYLNIDFKSGVEKSTSIAVKKLPKKRGMFLAPHITWNNSRTNSITTIQSFFVSNEITMKEFRLFLDYLYTHPDDTLKIHPANKIYARENVKKYHCLSLYKEIISYSPKDTLYDKYMLTDSSFYYDTSFDNYPITGISFYHADLYCGWRTFFEIDSKNKQIDLFMDEDPNLRSYYRLLDINEFDFLVQNCNTIEDLNTDILQKVSVKYLENLGSNADEFVIGEKNINNSEKRIYTVNYRGKLRLTNDSIRNPRLGFRIARSNLLRSKN